MPDESEDAFVDRYHAAGLFGGRCTPAEIDAVEARFGLRLPAAYRAFLRVAGRGGIASLVGSDYEIRHLPELRGWADELLADDGRPFELPANAFVFLVHQGYFFEYFLCEDGVADPVTYSYEEGRDGPSASEAPFSWWAKWKVER